MAETASESCPICKRPYKHDEEIDSSFRWCSEYCSTTTQAEKDQYLAAKPEDWCVFPCEDCGHAVEGTKEEGLVCWDCDHKRRDKEMAAILTETLPHLPLALLERAEKALGLTDEEIQARRKAKVTSQRFDVNESQYAKAGLFIDEHEKTHGRSKAAAGGRYHYRFCSTTIGLIVTIHCSCGESCDLSEDF